MATRWILPASLLAASLSPSLAGASRPAAAPYEQLGAKSKKLAEVRYIYRGLSVQPPHKNREKGKKGMLLFNQYFLQTQVKQKASIRFGDGTMLHMNQRTDAVLRTPHLTVVKSGTVDELLAPGSNHRVQTATAVAAAIGTNFVVQIVKTKRGKATRFVVVHGAVVVSNKYGPPQTVKTSQMSVVLPKQAPQPPVHVNVSQYDNWTKGMPAPKLGENIALDANGGSIVGGGATGVGASSTYTSTTDNPNQSVWNPKLIIDGRLDTGWLSDSGQVTNQWIKIALPGNTIHTITEVIIDPASTEHGNPAVPQADLRHFEIRVSTTDTADASFTPVTPQLECQDKDVLQTFKLSSPVQAKYVELYMYDNWGSPDWIAVAEMEVVGS